MKVTYTDEALRDLDEILTFIATNYPSITAAFQKRLRTVERRLGEWPMSAEEVIERPEVRMVPLIRYPYKIFYRITSRLWKYFISTTPPGRSRDSNSADRSEIVGWVERSETYRDCATVGRAVLDHLAFPSFLPRMWLFFAFSGPVLWAISIHLDKYLVGRYFAQTSVAVLLVFTALLGLLLLPLIWLLRPAVIELPPGGMALLALSGLLYMTAIFFYLQALQSEEASVVAPFFQAAPLFGYVLAYFVLGERLSAMQMVGGGLIVAGGALLSIGLGDRRPFKARLVWLMLACAFALALTGLIFKIYAVRDEFWTATFWTFVGQALFGGVVLAIAGYRRQFLALLRADPVPILAIGGLNELINLAGILGARYALLFAPLSLVQAIGSTTSLFVFMIGAGLSACYPALAREDLSAGNLAQKAASAVLIVIGAILINW